MQALDKYIDLLVAEMQRDMAVFHTTWLVVTIVPISLYLFYAFVKWYFLLMPITMPMTIWLASKARKPDVAPYKNN